MANGDHPPTCRAYYTPADVPKYHPDYCDCKRPEVDIETVMVEVNVYYNIRGREFKLRSSALGETLEHGETLEEATIQVLARARGGLLPLVRKKQDELN